MISAILLTNRALDHPYIMPSPRLLRPSQFLSIQYFEKHSKPVVQGFLAQEAHQPLPATSLPPKTVQGPLASVGLPL